MYGHVPQVESLGYVKFNPEVKVEGGHGTKRNFDRLLCTGSIKLEYLEMSQNFISAKFLTWK